MTPANRKRLSELSQRIGQAARLDASSDALVLLIFGWQEQLIGIASDLHMRPEANDGRTRGKKE